MFSKTEARERIKSLVEKYERLSPQRKKSYNEADTRRDFIMPLFKGLGWDVYNDFTENEVVEEETSITGRIDYSFRLNNITQFVLEAKAIPEDLDKEQWAKQAVEYGWNKGIPWVVLTDFEGLKVFNSEWKKEHPQANVDLGYKEYLDKFDRLWLLSKESIQKGELDKRASEWGITAKRESVNEHLAKDLLGWRKLLTDSFCSWNKEYKQEDIEEAVQRILDRLIFMRVVEDRGLEEKRLWQAFKKWEKDGYEPQNFIEKLAPIFRNFDQKYNSNLFEKHLCESLYTTQEPFKKILPDLYASKEGGVKYRFNAINADVLGNVYEQYLGHVQGRDGGQSKRKKQGIYYTPIYIVDYIVQNTLGKLLEESSLTQIEKIKVLDPACGSGSFLIKAFDILNEKLKKERGGKDGVQAALRKYRILTENIYGVDLDPQAVEIARLNLLLKALEPNYKLPMLNENIKNGNSLIDDKKFTDKPFNWQEEFSNVFKGSGFDVIIGNPPYIQLSMEKELSDELKVYLLSTYESSMGRLNTFGFFIRRGIELLKDGGYLGFIIPNTILTQDYYEELRKYILDTCAIESIVLFDNLPFKDAVVENVVLILKKTKTERIRTNHKASIYKVSGYLSLTHDKVITQKLFNKTHKYGFNINLDERQQLLKRKLEKNSSKLSELAEINQAIALKHERAKYLSKTKKGPDYKPVLDGRNIGRYFVKWEDTYLKYDIEAIHSSKRESIFLSKEKLFFRRVGEHLIGAFDNKQFYALNTLVVVNLKKEVIQNIKYILALFNSKLLNWYYQSFLKSTKKVFSEIQARQVAQLPIKNTNFDNKKDIQKHDKIIALANEIIVLNDKIQKLSANTDKFNHLKSRIEKLDYRIDHEVYKLYNLTPKEIEVVEKS